MPVPADIARQRYTPCVWQRCSHPKAASVSRRDSSLFAVHLLNNCCLKTAVAEAFGLSSEARHDTLYFTENLGLFSTYARGVCLGSPT